MLPAPFLEVCTWPFSPKIPLPRNRAPSARSRPFRRRTGRRSSVRTSPSKARSPAPSRWSSKARSAASRSSPASCASAPRRASKRPCTRATSSIEGKLNGDISADERVELVASATVDGNIKAPKIVVAEGAKFRGSVDMGSTPRRSAKTRGERRRKQPNSGAFRRNHDCNRYQHLRAETRSCARRANTRTTSTASG